MARPKLNHSGERKNAKNDVDAAFFGTAPSRNMDVCCIRIGGDFGLVCCAICSGIFNRTAVAYMAEWYDAVQWYVRWLDDTFFVGYGCRIDIRDTIWLLSDMAIRFPRAA